MKKAFRSAIHDIAERLRCSAQPDYRTSKALGFHHGAARYPVLLSDGMFEGGMWVLGAQRSGKTQRVLSPLIMQDIAMNTRPVVVIDMKGDDVLYKTVQHEAAAHGRPLLVLSNVPQIPTRLFNPFTQRHVLQLPAKSVTEHTVASLNLWFGFEYGMGFYSAQSLVAFQNAYLTKDTNSRWGMNGKPTRARSFVEIAQRLPQVIKDHPEVKGADALVMAVKQMANVFLLNGGCCDLYPSEAMAAEIQFDEFLLPNAESKFAVLYCYLRPESEPVTSSLIAKLVINHIKNAMRQRADDIQLRGATGPLPLVSFYIDEAHHVLDKATENMLSQGASMGMRFVLANQDISQLNLRDRDYFPTVWENCAMKVILSARDNELQELMMKLSGEKSVREIAYLLNSGYLDSQRMNPANAEEGLCQVRESVKTRFERNHVIEMSATPGQAIFFPPQNEPLGRYNGYPIMIDLPFLYSKVTFERLKKSPWPAHGADMVVAQDFADQWEAFLSENLP